MKILQLATSVEGGAGLAASRAHEALLQNGVDSTLLYLRGPQSEPKANRIKFNRSPVDKLTSRALTFLQGEIVQVDNQLISTFSLDVLHKHPELLKGFDVIHIHAMYNFINQETLDFLASSGTGVVITMHDMRLATGGCHYSGNCRRYESTCGGCPLVRSLFRGNVKNAKLKQASVLRKFKNLTVVTPSMWLNEAVRNLPEFKNTQIITVNNPVPETYFMPRIKSQSGNHKIGFIAANLNNPYKGLDNLIDAANKLKNQTQLDFELVFMGEGKVSNLDPKIVWNQRSSHSEKDVRKFYDEIDLLCVPSTEDNSPSVIAEALASGVSVVGTKVGGISELLNVFEMQVVSPGDTNSLASGISLSLSKPNKSDHHDLARKMFSFSSYAKTMKQIYEYKLN